MTHMSDHSPYWGLPDPDRQAEFYADTASKRAVAWLVDAVIVAILVTLAVIFTAFVGLFFLGFLTMAISFAYRTVTIATGSATLGMRLAAIELRTAQGERLGLGLAALHTAGYLASVAFVFPQIVSIVLMLTTARGQGLTDHVLGTAALNRRARA